jgi:hypothetical protein
MRSFFSVLVFALLLYSAFPVGPIRWAVDIMWGSTGDTGVEQAGDFSDTGAVTDSEDDCVASRVRVSDCKSSRSHASMNEIPPFTLLVSRLFHPPTAHI